MWFDPQPAWFVFAVALGALLIDRLFGEFLDKYHPVVLIGRLIGGFEARLYADTVFRGALLVTWTLALSGLAAFAVAWLLAQLPLVFSLTLSALFASTLLAHRMLHDTVRALIDSDNPNRAVAMLVSRDTADLSRSDCYKAGIETYAENLSDGVIAPLFYLLLFGLPGLVLYKAINTLDSMVGYRIDRYERFGKTAARLDDLANWIPARITAALILLVKGRLRFWAFYQDGRGHASPNAGHPITAMALACRIRLGGPTDYFGRRMDKPHFGEPASLAEINKSHLQCALSLRNRIDLTLISLVFAALIIINLSQ